MNIPIFGLYLKKLKCIPIERGRITKENLNFSEQILKNISLGNNIDIDRINKIFFIRFS